MDWVKLFHEIDDLDKEVAAEVALFVEEVPCSRRERVGILARNRGEIRNSRFRLRLDDKEDGGAVATLYVGPDWYGVCSV